MVISPKEAGTAPPLISVVSPRRYVLPKPDTRQGEGRRENGQIARVADDDRNGLPVAVLWNSIPRDSRKGRHCFGTDGIRIAAFDAEVVSDQALPSWMSK